MFLEAVYDYILLLSGLVVDVDVVVVVVVVYTI
jgi:hypothetical protein